MEIDANFEKNRLRTWSEKTEIISHKAMAILVFLEKSKIDITRSQWIQIVKEVLNATNPAGTVASLATNSGNNYGRVTYIENDLVKLSWPDFTLSLDWRISNSALEKVSKIIGKDPINVQNKSQDLLTNLINEYKEFKNSENYDEQYKWDYAIKNQHIFQSLDNLKDKFDQIGSPNFQTYFMRNSGIKWLLNKSPEILEESFRFLFDETSDLKNRINDFRGTIRSALISDEGWKNKNLTEPGVDTASFFLFTNDYKKYMLFSAVTPFNNYAKKLGISDLFKKNTNEERYISWQEYFVNTLIPKMNEVLGSEHMLLDAQDFIWYIGNKQKPDDLDINDLREELLNYGVDLGAIRKDTDTYIASEGKSSYTGLYVDKLVAEISSIQSTKKMFDILTRGKYLTEDLLIGTKKTDKWGDKNTYFEVSSKEQMSQAKKIVEAAVYYEKFNSVMPVSKGNYSNKKRYWMYAPGEQSSKWEEFYDAKIMGIGWEEIGDLSQYSSKEDIKLKMKEVFGPERSYKNNGHATWQFANDIKIGDIVFVKNGLTKIVGRGVVESDYIFDKTRDEYNSVRKVNWTHKGEWDYDGQIVLKTLTDVTPYTEYCKKLESIFAENLVTEEIDEYESYSETDFLNEVYMDEEKYNVLKNLLLNKKNIILQGAPGVGKTFVAKRLAYSIIGKKDTNRVKMVQFHQSYGYEDFIMGYRPKDNGFELKEGPFYEFCKEAESDTDNDYFFIIDEINRGHLSKVFGELLMLIETDKRGESIRLLYRDEQFSVPPNVHIVGMMNTADRGIAMIDYALRRRFSFYDFEPAFETESFKDYQAEKANEKFNNLINVISSLNNAISQDNSLGECFKIGHSYFCTNNAVDDEWLSALVHYEIVPLLKEYWFDETDKYKNWSNQLNTAIK